MNTTISNVYFHDKLIANSALIKSFSNLYDPRVKRTQKHNMLDIIMIAICAVICGADDWVKVAEFGEAKISWFKTFLELPNGIPSHDTFARFFSIVSPEKFQQCFLYWIEQIQDNTGNSIIALDGKTIRNSHDTSSQKSAIHMINAWCSTNKLVLGQLKTETKSNEITALPKLLDLISVSGNIITIDAIGCQKAIAAKINALEGYYVLAVKANQKTLHNLIKDFFNDQIITIKPSEYENLNLSPEEQALLQTAPYIEPECEQYPNEQDAAFMADDDDCALFNESIANNLAIDSSVETSITDRKIKTFTEVNKSHGRVELRKYYLTADIPNKTELQGYWHGLNVIGAVDRIRICNNKIARTMHYYIGSIEHSAKLFAQAVRSHWQVENSLHWSLDVIFREDQSRIRAGHSAENFAVLRQIALNCLKNERSAKVGIATKRLKSGWDENYLLKVLATFRNNEPKKDNNDEIVS